MEEQCTAQAGTVTLTRPGTSERVPRLIDVTLIRYNPLNPRQRVGAEQLAALAESIGANGLLQPIEVRPLGDGTFEAVYGNTRLRAHKELLAPRDPARWGRIACFIAEVSDLHAFIRSWEENDKRSDLSQADELAAVEHALAIGLTVARDLAALRRIFRRSESWVRRRARLVALPALRERIIGGVCTIDEAFEALSASNNDPEAAALTLDRVRALDLSRRDFRALLRAAPTPERSTAAVPGALPNGSASVEACSRESTEAPSRIAPPAGYPPAPPPPSDDNTPPQGQPAAALPGGEAARVGRASAAGAPPEDTEGGPFATLVEALADGLDELAALAHEREGRLTVRTLATTQAISCGRLVAAPDLLHAFRDDLLSLLPRDERPHAGPTGH